MYAVPSLLVSENDDRSGYPTIKVPNRNSFTVRNFYADMKRHDLGPAFHERNFDGTLRMQFMTEPLWGVGSSAPYGHDGRSSNRTSIPEIATQPGSRSGDMAASACRSSSTIRPSWNSS